MPPSLTCSSDDDFERLPPNATAAPARCPLGASSQAAAQATASLQPAAKPKGGGNSGCRQPPETVGRVHELCREGRSLSGIRNKLNEEGFKNSRGQVWPINNDHAVVIRIIAKKGFTVPPLDTDGEEEDKGEGDEAAAVMAAGDDDEAAAEGEGGAEPPKDGPRSRRGTGSDAPPPTYNERQLSKLSKPSQAAASAKAAKPGDGTNRRGRQPSSQLRAPPASQPVAKRPRGAAALAEESNLVAFKLKLQNGEKCMLDRTLSFAALCDEARKALYPGLPPAEQPLVRRFTFRDHEGDMIAIMNDMQLKNAVSSTPSDTLPNLNARALICTTCAQSAHTSRRHCNPTVTNCVTSAAHRSCPSSWTSRRAICSSRPTPQAGPCRLPRPPCRNSTTRRSPLLTERTSHRADEHICKTSSSMHDASMLQVQRATRAPRADRTVASEAAASRSTYNICQVGTRHGPNEFSGVVVVVPPTTPVCD